MNFKKVSILAVSFMAISISSTIFAENGSSDVNDFFKSFDNEERESLDDPFAALDRDLKSLENTINRNDESILTNEINDNVDFTIDPEINDAEKDQASQDVIFLRNIPEGTRITVNKEFIILPQNKFIIFHEGKRVIENPLSKNPINSFCYLEFKPSGKARVLKEGKVFTVTKNQSESMILRNKDDDSEKLITYETKLSVDNDSVNWLTCYSAGDFKDSAKIRPLNIKDLREHSYGSFKLEFPAYEEI